MYVPLQPTHLKMDRHNVQVVLTRLTHLPLDRDGLANVWVSCNGPNGVIYGAHLIVDCVA